MDYAWASAGFAGGIDEQERELVLPFYEWLKSKLCGPQPSFEDLHFIEHLDQKRRKYAQKVINLLIAVKPWLEPWVRPHPHFTSMFYYIMRQGDSQGLRQRKNAVIVLLSLGANPLVVDSHGKQPLDYVVPGTDMHTWFKKVCMRYAGGRAFSSIGRPASEAIERLQDQPWKTAFDELAPMVYCAGCRFRDAPASSKKDDKQLRAVAESALKVTGALFDALSVSKFLEWVKQKPACTCAIGGIERVLLPADVNIDRFATFSRGLTVTHRVAMLGWLPSDLGGKVNPEVQRVVHERAAGFSDSRNFTKPAIIKVRRLHSDIEFYGNVYSVALIGHHLDPQKWLGRGGVDVLKQIVTGGETIVAQASPQHKRGWQQAAEKAARLCFPKNGDKTGPRGQSEFMTAAEFLLYQGGHHGAWKCDGRLPPLLSMMAWLRRAARTDCYAFGNNIELPLSILNIGTDRRYWPGVAFFTPLARKQVEPGAGAAPPAKKARREPEHSEAGGVPGWCTAYEFGQLWRHHLLSRPWLNADADDMPWGKGGTPMKQAQNDSADSWKIQFQEWIAAYASAKDFLSRRSVRDCPKGTGMITRYTPVHYPPLLIASEATDNLVKKFSDALKTYRAHREQWQRRLLTTVASDLGSAVGMPHPMATVGEPRMVAAAKSSLNRLTGELARSLEDDWARAWQASRFLYPPWSPSVHKTSGLHFRRAVRALYTSAARFYAANELPCNFDVMQCIAAMLLPCDFAMIAWANERKRSK